MIARPDYHGDPVRCHACGIEIGHFEYARGRSAWFVTRPGLAVSQRDGQLYEFRCSCGALRRFEGTDRTVRIRVSRDLLN